MEVLRVTQGLLDARATFQRLGDALILHGWIVGVEGARLQVRATDDSPLQIGDRFAVRTARLNGDVAFLAILRGAATVCAEEGLRRAATSDRPTMLDFGDRSYTFEVLGQMVPMPASGDPRYICEPSRVVIGHSEGELRDVSPTGLGVVTPTPHQVGEQLGIEMESAGRTVRAQAEVMYCRQLATFPPRYRVGLHILSGDRIDRARWLRVVKERSQPRSSSRFTEDPPPLVEPMPLPLPEETGIEWAITAAEILPEPLPEAPTPESGIELWEGRT